MEIREIMEKVEYTSLDEYKTTLKLQPNVLTNNVYLLLLLNSKPVNEDVVWVQGLLRDLLKLKDDNKKIKLHDLHGVVYSDHKYISKALRKRSIAKAKGYEEILNSTVVEEYNNACLKVFEYIKAEVLKSYQTHFTPRQQYFVSPLVYLIESIRLTGSNAKNIDTLLDSIGPAIQDRGFMVRGFNHTLGISEESVRIRLFNGFDNYLANRKYVLDTKLNDGLIQIVNKALKGVESLSKMDMKNINYDSGYFNHLPLLSSTTLLCKVLLRPHIQKVIDSCKAVDALF